MDSYCRSPRRWNDRSVLAIADAKGHVQLHTLQDSEVSTPPEPLT